MGFYMNFWLLDFIAGVDFGVGIVILLDVPF